MNITKLEQHEQAVDILLADHHTAESQVGIERGAMRDAINHLDATIEACEVVQTIAAETQARAHSAIAAVVSRCLTAVFDEPYTFKIDFERKRGKTEARLYFVRDGIEIDPLTAAGGGVVDVAAFALRLACILLHRPQLRPLMVLDEPFRFVSANYLPRVRDLIDGLADEFGVQFVIVSHLSELKDENTIYIE